MPLKQAYNRGVSRPPLLAVLVLAVLCGYGQAQHSSPPPRGPQGNRSSGRRGSGAFHRRGGADSGFFPYYESFGYEQGQDEVAPQPQVVVQRMPDAPIPKGQLIEVAPAANSVPRLLPPTIFILANGERLESRRFVLTASTLSISIDRQHRNLPLGLVDIDATIAANRERGIDLRIPDDRNEISLGF